MKTLVVVTAALAVAAAGTYGQKEVAKRGFEHGGVRPAHPDITQAVFLGPSSSSTNRASQPSSRTHGSAPLAPAPPAPPAPAPSAPALLAVNNQAGFRGPLNGVGQNLALSSLYYGARAGDGAGVSGFSSGLNLGGGFGNGGFGSGGSGLLGYARQFQGYQARQGLQGAHVISEDLHTTIYRQIGVPVNRPYPVPVTRDVPVAVPHPVPYQVDRPFPVPVAVRQPYPVDQPIPTPVDRPVPVPVAAPYPVPVAVRQTVPVPVPQPVPVPVSRSVPVPVPVTPAVPQFGLALIVGNSGPLQAFAFNLPNAAPQQLPSQFQFGAASQSANSVSVSQGNFAPQFNAALQQQLSAPQQFPVPPLQFSATQPLPQQQLRAPQAQFSTPSALPQLQIASSQHIPQPQQQFPTQLPVAQSQYPQPQQQFSAAPQFSGTLEQSAAQLPLSKNEPQILAPVPVSHLTAPLAPIPAPHS